MEPQDFQMGSRPIKVDRQSRAGAVVSVRLTEEEIERLEEVADSQHATISRLAREAIRLFLGFPTKSGFPVDVTTKGDLSDLKIEVDPPPIDKKTTGRVRDFGCGAVSSR